MLSTRAKRVRQLTFSVCCRGEDNDFVTPFRAAALIEATWARNTSSRLHRFVGVTERDFNRSGALSVLTLQQRAAPATVDFVRCRAREILPVLYTYLPTYSDYSRVQYNNRILLSRSRSTWLPLRKSR